MKKFDWYFQTTALVIAISCLAAGLYLQEAFAILHFLQIILGGWQFFTALVSYEWKAQMGRRIYLFTASIYLYLYVILANAGIASIALMDTYLYRLPWVLIGGYYAFTWRNTFYSHLNRGKFLPHINF